MNFFFSKFFLVHNSYLFMQLLINIFICFLPLTRTWEILPDLLINRGCHGCTRTKMNNSDYLVVLGGQTSTTGIVFYSSIHFYNLAKKVWESYPSQIALPLQLTHILGIHNLQMNEAGCDIMMVVNYPSVQLWVCKNNYEWTSYDLTGKIDSVKKLVLIGAAALAPC